MVDWLSTTPDRCPSKFNELNKRPSHLPAPLNACTGSEPAGTDGTHSIWKADGFSYRTIVYSTARAREFPQTLLRRSLLLSRAAIRATARAETLRKADMPGKARPASTRNSAR